jgi:hypothetical protein
MEHGFTAPNEAVSASGFAARVRNDRATRGPQGRKRRPQESKAPGPVWGALPLTAS